MLYLWKTETVLVVVGLYLAFVAAMIDANAWYNKLLFKGVPTVLAVVAVAVAIRGM